MSSWQESVSWTRDAPPLADRPEVVSTEAESARLLVRAVGGLPLALTIAGNYLRTQAYSKQPRRIRAALPACKRPRSACCSRVPAR